MEPNTITFIAELQLWDRFYKLTDAKKQEWVKVDAFYCIPAAIVDCPLLTVEIKERALSIIKNETAVVFLRHADANI